MAPVTFYEDLSAVSFPDSAALLGLPAGFYCNRTARENSRHFLKLGGGVLSLVRIQICLIQKHPADVLQKDALTLFDKTSFAQRCQVRLFKSAAHFLNLANAKRN